MKTDRLIKTILFATDFSSCAESAYLYALFMAVMWEAQISILHVLECQPDIDPQSEINRLYFEDRRKEAVRKLDHLLQRARKLDVTRTVHQTIGIPSQEINEMARKLRSDVVVVGTHGCSGLKHVLLGSTAERVVTGSPCPVLTVRQDETPSQPIAHKDTNPITIKRILVPIDFSDCSMDALEYAAQVAHQLKAEILLLHVMEPVPYGLDFTLSHPAELDKNRQRSGGQLKNLVAALRGSGLVADHVLRGGMPAEGILEETRDHGSDLIVMGTHGRRGISHLVSGSVTEMVLRWARCPILTVRSPNFSPGYQRLVSVGQRQEETL